MGLPSTCLSWCAGRSSRSPPPRMRTWSSSPRGKRVSETRIKVPGVFYVGASPSVERIVAQRRGEARKRPVVLFLGAGESFARLGEVRYGVHVGRPRGEPAASHWVFDRASAVELLARLAFAWSAPAPTP